jgi:uncharacterized protein (TIGR00661 family)
MKVLYAIQGTGNGHITRAIELIDALKKRVKFDILLSGNHSEIDLGHQIKYRCEGVGFKFGKRGGVDFRATWKSSKYSAFLKEVRSLDLSEYDLVINDFEPVSAWAAKMQQVPGYGLSNQCVLASDLIPKPSSLKGSQFFKALLKYYAPVDVSYGFHYFSMNHFIMTPVIRKEIRNLTTVEGDEYLVYLPFYGDEKLQSVLTRFPDVKWNVFSKHAKTTSQFSNVTIRPLDSDAFLTSLAACRGVFSSAGFGLTSEVLFLGKKLLVMPMKGQFEQRCNAHTLNSIGIPSIESLKPSRYSTIDKWLSRDVTMQISYSDNSAKVIDKLLTDFYHFDRSARFLNSAKIPKQAEESPMYE